MAPDEVDFVSAHATGTKLNDPAEAKAIRAVFGAHAARVAVSSGKSEMGHLLAAAGAVSFAGAVLSVARGAIPPTANLADVDPSCALDHVVGRRPHGARAGGPGERARVRRPQCHDRGPPLPGDVPVIRADLKDRVAVVTGGARGIGAAVCRRLAASGAKVVVNWSRSEAPARALVEEIVAAGGVAEAVQGRRQPGGARSPRCSRACSSATVGSTSS